MKEVKKNKIKFENWSINLMYLPAIFLFSLFVIYPMFTGIKISFTNWNGFSQSYKYVGFENYIAVLKDKNVWSSFSNTIVYGVGSTIFQQLAGLSMALLINSKFKGRTLGRTVIYMPVLIAAVIMGNMWYFLLQYDGGAVNDIVILMGKEPVDWLTQGNLTVWIIVMVNTLQFYGISMVIYLAGLQGIPQMYYEAAEIDGAKRMSKFFNITVPLLMPAIATSVVLNLIGGLKLFDVVKALTNGGPGYSTHSLSTLVNFTYFNNQSAGYASVIGLLLFTFIVAVSLVAQKFFKSREVDI